MTINPTYLARKTRSCAYSLVTSTSPTLLIEYSCKLGGCEAASAEGVSAMDSSSKYSDAITAQHRRDFHLLTALRPLVRLLKSNLSIPSICHQRR
jgi:hypothetical protein